MDQKQRNKMAWILIGVLVPLLIFLLAINTAKVRKTPSPGPAPASAGQPAKAPGAEVVPPPRPAPSVDPRIVAEQKRIAALLPKNNPFNPSRSGNAEPPPPASAPKPAAPAVAAPPPAAPRLTAIVSRQGGTGRLAMINGRFLGEGDSVAGWTIVKVNPRDVLLDNGTRQIVLMLK